MSVTVLEVFQEVLNLTCMNVDYVLCMHVTQTLTDRVTDRGNTRAHARARTDTRTQGKKVKF